MCTHTCTTRTKLKSKHHRKDTTCNVLLKKNMYPYVNPTSTTTVDDSCVHVYNLYLHNLYITSTGPLSIHM